MQETLYQTADAEDTLSDRQDAGETADAETQYQTADAGDTLSDSGCRNCIRQRMHSKTADAGDTLYQTVDAAEVSLWDSGVSLSDSGCSCLSRQRMR